MMVLQLSFTYIPFMQGVFRTAGMSWLEWGIAIGAGVITLAVTECDKMIRLAYRKWAHRDHTAQVAR